MSIVWGVSELGLPFFEPGDGSPIAATLDAHAEYDGWLVTTEDKVRLFLFEFTDGWYAQETADGSSWRWTQQTATLSFLKGISAEPDGPWVTQLMRHATDAEDGFLRHIRFLIHDRDPLFRPAGRDPLPRPMSPPSDAPPARRT